MMGKRILISAGGTGGHLYPAQALGEQLAAQDPPCDILFAAGGLNASRYFNRDRFPFQEVSCSPLLVKNPVRAMAGLKNLVKGTRESIRMIERFKPDVVVGFGSYYTTPILIAAKWMKIPIIVHEANSIPGKANKWMASFADAVALNFPSAASYFKQRTVEVGLPLRDGYFYGSVSKGTAAAHYGLSSEKEILLVCGGSQGAKAINRLMEGCFNFIHQSRLQVIHLTGDHDEADRLSSLYAAHGIPAAVKPFEDQMQIAWSAADAFVGRSGASTVAESLEFEVPGILIPYPYATDQHQKTNAEYLVDTVGSGIMLLEDRLTPNALVDTLTSFFQGRQVERYKDALRRIKCRPNQISLCQLVLEFVNQ